MTMFRALAKALPQQATTAPATPEAGPMQQGLTRHVSDSAPLIDSVPLVGALWDTVTASTQAFDPETILASQAYDRYLARAPEERPADAVKYGEELLRIEETLGREHLTYLSGDDGYRALKQLIAGNDRYGFGELVHSFIAYVKLYNPQLHAKNGQDFISFMKHEPGSLLAHQTTVPYVRSPHRLDPIVLQLLASNFRDQSKSRPLVVVVMPALDLDGDLHAMNALAPIVSQTKTLGLVIEAGKQLKDVQHALQEIAVAYGPENRIQDLVFVGHDFFETEPPADQIEVAGQVSFKPASGETTKRHRRIADIDARTYRESLTVPQGNDPGHDVLDVEHFISQLLFISETRWGAAVPSRLVLDIHFGQDSGSPTNKFSRALSTQKDVPNLIRQLAGNYLRGDGVPGQPALELVTTNLNLAKTTKLVVDIDGRPTLVSSGDTAAVASKLDYVRSGMDPERVLRAIIDVWEPAWPVVQQRVNAPPQHGDPWTGDVMHALLSLVLEQHLLAQKNDHSSSKSSPWITQLARVTSAIQSLSQVQSSGMAKELVTLVKSRLDPELSKALYERLVRAVRSSNSLPMGHEARIALQYSLGRVEDVEPSAPQKQPPRRARPRSPLPAK